MFNNNDSSACCFVLIRMCCFQSASVSQSAAAVAMGDKLKRDLQDLRRKKAAPVTSTPMSDDSDNTEIDMFENIQRQSRKRVSNVLF